MEAEIVPLPPQREWTTRFGIKFYRYKNLIKRRWWFLLLTLSIGLAYEGWVLFRTQTSYESTGMLLMGERVVVTDAGLHHEDADNFYGTQLQLLQNTDLHDMATRRVALDAPNLQPCKVDVTPTLSPRSSIFSVVGRGQNGEYTQHFVDALMQEFLAYKRNALGKIMGGAEGSLSAELTRLGDERAKRDAQLQDFIKENNMAFWEQQAKSAAVYTSDLKTKYADLATELQRLQSLSSKELLSRPAPTASAQNPGGATLATDANQQYLLKSQELIQAKAEFAERSRVWKPAHPRLIAMKEQIASLERLLGTIEDQSRDATQVQIGAIKTELDVLGSKIKEWDQKASEASQKDAEYQRLKEALNRTSSNYDKLLGSVQDIDRAKTTDSGTVQIIQDASAPKEVNAGTFRHLFTGIFLGLLAGVGALVVMDRADDRFTSSTEVMEHFSEPILGQIPDVEASRTKSGLPLLQEEDERYTFAESFRSLRSSLIFMPNQQGALKSVLITSSIPGEGKSTIASNLAVTMALAGTRVLLVDADLRRGDLASIFNTDGRFGLSSVLRGEIPWKTAAKTTPYPTLMLIPRGPVTNQSSELLLTPRLETLLAEWKNAFDLVIFNTSPILATDDTASIAPQFDGALMVLRAQFTSARLVRNSMNAMYQRQVNVLGLILNCVDTQMPDYYYYRYPKYYAA
jgi:succinoglycan biosynthesis transport protein ExoP